MFKIGDVIIYSEHGLCQIDDICEKTYSGITRNYYELHPLANTNLKISFPVDSDKVVMLKTMEKEEAEELLETFKQSGVEWIEFAKQRNNEYVKIVQSGNRKEIAKVANTLMRKNFELKLDGKKLYDQDRRILDTIQSILFKELALSLNTSYEKIAERVENIIKE